MRQHWLKRFLTVLRNLKYVPALVRMVVEVVEAQEDAAQLNYLAAERRLLRVYGMAPPGAVERSTTNLLMALVSLRLGNAEAAAELAPAAISHVGSLRVFANSAERDYLRYAGRQIYEEATRQLGKPDSLDVGVEYGDLDVQKVRSALRDAYPVVRPPATVAQQIH